MFRCWVYIHKHVFRPSHDSSVWLGLTSREQLVSPYAHIYIYIYIYICYFTLCKTHIYNMPERMIYHNAFVVISRRSDCTHTYIYVMLILLLWDSRTCMSWINYDHLWVHLDCTFFISSLKSFFEETKYSSFKNMWSDFHTHDFHIY